MKIDTLRFAVQRDDWLSQYVDDPLQMELMRTDEFKLAVQLYEEQKRMPNTNGWHHEVSILIYYDGEEIAYISDSGELRSLDYLTVLDISLDELRQLFDWRN